MTAPTYRAGISPWKFAVADFNGDGIPDVAVANSGDAMSVGAGVSVLLGNGDGTFQPPKSQLFGRNSYSIAVGDFNGDGHLDLAVTGVDDNSNGALSVLLGNGDGTFQEPQTYIVRHPANSVAVGDFNGDGVLDLVVAGGPGVVILLGNGDGTFQETQNYAPGGQHVAVGDFNGDGILDLAVVRGIDPSDSTLNILLGNGDGTFQAPQSYPVRQGPFFVAVGDFNGDGIPDLALAIAGARTGHNAGLSILLGKGNGTFQEAPYYETGANPVFLAVGDFNGDGLLDLALTNESTVNIFLGNGDGGFQVAGLYAAGGGPASVALADFNGDGKLDIVTNGGPDSVSIMLGNGDGTFQAARSYWNGGSLLGFTSIATGDFNQDGIADLAVVNSDDGTATIFLGKGDGSFQLGQTYAAGGGTVVVADFNGDGIPDLAVLAGVLLGNGDGTFQPLLPFAAGNGPNFLAVGDFNGDGKLDIVTTNFAVLVGNPRNPSDYKIIENGVRVLLGNGDGTFQPPQAIPLDLSGPRGSRPEFVVVGDFNGDGVLDLAVANTESGAVSILLGKGDGSFGPVRNYQIGYGLVSLAVGDLNGDGHLDLVAAGTAAGVTVLLGNGDGTFQQGANYPVPWTYPLSVAVADFNRDGVLDIVVADGLGVTLLLGKGDGTFQVAGNYAAGSGGWLAVADFNGDGWPDLALSNSATILLNQP